jgi:hypothetical protein
MNMRTADYALVTTLIAAASIVGFVSQAEAAMKAQDKYAVLEKCEADARLANPDNGSARYKAYAACMRKNGLKAWSY